jgi:ATP-dependent helicase/DNAse subunit B
MAYLLTNKKFDELYPLIAPNEIVSDFINRDSMADLLLIYPTSKLTKYNQARIIREYYSKLAKPISRLNIFSMYKFIGDRFKKAFADKPKKELSEAYSLALFEEAATAAKLEYFSNKSMTPNLLKRLYSIISGLKDDGVSADSLSLEALEAEDDENVDKSKMRDLSELLRNYDKLLGEKYADAADLLPLLNKRIELGSPDYINPDDLLKEYKLIVFDGFTEFASAEFEFVGRLYDSNTAIAVYLDYSVKDGPLLGGIETAIEELSSRGFALRELNPQAKDLSLPSNYLRKYLFMDKSYQNKSPILNAATRVVAAKNRLSEAKFIAKLVKELCVNRGYELSDICICSRKPESYADIFREVFYQYNIPANITNRIPLSNSPIIISIFAIFEMINRGYKRADIARAFSSNFIDTGAFGDEGADINNLLYVANLLRIDGGYSKGGSLAWINSLKNAEIAYQKRIEEFKNSDYEDLEFEAKTALDTLEKIKKARTDFNSIFEHFKAPKELSSEEFKNFVKANIVNKLKLKSSIKNKYAEVSQSFSNNTESENLIAFENIEKESRAYYSFLTVLEETCFILKDRYSAEHFPFKKLTDILKTAVDGKKYQIREKSNYGVNVTAIEQIRGVPYKVAILCGMVDGDIPLTYRPEIFLGKEIPDTEREHYVNEKMQFYQFLTNNPEALDKGEKMIFLTYPEFEDKNQNTRSQYLDYLFNIAALEENGRLFRYSEAPMTTGDELMDSVSRVLASKIEISQKMSQLNLNEYQKRNKFIDDIISDCAVSKGFSEDSDNALELRPDSLSESNKVKLSAYLNKTYSATEFDSFASCSLKYFYERMMRLKEPLEFDFSLSPLELGNLAHLILFKFYRAIQSIQNDKDYHLLDAKPDCDVPPAMGVRLQGSEREYYKSLLIDIADEEIEKLRFSHPVFDVDKENLIGSENRKGLLEYWLDEELNKIENWDWLYLPTLFETSFVTSFDTTDMISGENRTLKLRGKIDRIEAFISDNPIDPNNADKAKKSARLRYMIADYKSKTSSTPSSKDIKDYKSFQIPLYLAAANKYMSDNYQCCDIELAPEGGAYYSYKNSRAVDKATESNYHALVIPIKDNPIFQKTVIRKPRTKTIFETSDDIEYFLQNSIKQAGEIVRKISVGRFEYPEAPTKACRNCGLGGVCRINDTSKLDDNDEIGEE